MITFDSMENCTLCPRNCGIDRLRGKIGYCGQSSTVKGARAALHFWEEPIISGTNGSGAVFFSGCNLRCIFCQNYSIALGKVGKEISVERLADIYLELQEKGAHNINLVTGTPFIPQIASSLEIAKNQGLTIPIVYNTGSYENVSSLKMLEGLIDIYLPDMKYFSSELSFKFSKASDYFEVASAAIGEMVRQVGKPVIVNEDKDFITLSGKFGESSVYDFKDTVPLLKKGVMVRHLLLPGQVKDSKKILRYLHETYGNSIYISIMNQYTPLPQVANIPELNKRVSPEEYDRLVRFAEALGIENAFIQEEGVAQESFIPDFDYEGI